MRRTVRSVLPPASAYFHTGTEFYEVRARLALLGGEYKVAETIYLEQGKAQEAIQMYQSLHRWSDALDVARMAVWTCALPSRESRASG